jgi:hypothetical protein
MTLSSRYFPANPPKTLEPMILGLELKLKLTIEKDYPY